MKTKINYKELNVDIINVSHCKIDNCKCFRIHYYDMIEQEDEFILVKTNKYSNINIIKNYFTNLKNKKDKHKYDACLSFYY